MNLKPLISTEKVKELLPQKEPFVMVHDLLDYNEEEITTGFLVEKDNIFIENGLFNESGLIENVAQTTALHTSYSYYIKDEIAPVGYIAQIQNTKVENFPKVGDYIITTVKILAEFDDITLVNGLAKLKDQTLVKTRMKTYLAKS